MNKLQRSKDLERVIMSNMRRGGMAHNFMGRSCDGLGFAELNILKMVDEKKSVSPKQLADEYETTAAAVTHHVNALVEKGYILRRESKLDKRVKELSITKKGLRMLERSHLGKFTDFTNELMDYLGAKDSDNLIRIIEKVGKFKREYIKKESERKHV